MKVKKLGHCCFIVEINGKHIMTDPGAFSTLQNEETGIDVVVYTHEHQDHFHLESLQKIIENNPSVIIIANTAVGLLLTDADIAYTKVEEGETYDFEGVKISGFGSTHAEIYHSFGQVQNTGYMIGTLCYPGDAFHHPDTDVDVLALPVAGPWMRMKDAIDYAKSIRPRIVFPVHDAIVQDFAQSVWRTPEILLAKENIGFKKLELGVEEEI